MHHVEIIRIGNKETLQRSLIGQGDFLALSAIEATWGNTVGDMF